MHVVETVIFVCWAVFWIFWLAAAFGAKSGRTRWGQFAGIRVAGILIVLFLVRLRVFKGSHAVTTNPWLQGIGLVIFALGLALAVWARLYIGRNWGMPMSQKADPELVTTGPYHAIRHPIYSGVILAMVGTTIAVSLYWLIAVGLVAAYFFYSAVVEERNMAKAFPEAYPPYKRSTKMLIPYIV